MPYNMQYVTARVRVLARPNIRTQFSILYHALYGKTQYKIFKN